MATKNLSATITIGGLVGSSLKSAFGQTEKGVDQIGSKVRELTSRQKELNQVIKQQEQLGRAGSALKVQYAQQELAALDKQIAKLQRVQNLEKSRQAIAAKTGEARSKMIGATVGFTVAAAPLIGAAKIASDFQYEMQMIGNTADMTNTEILSLGNSILDLSSKTGQSSQSVQKAMGFLVAAGMNAKTAEDSLFAIGKTATAAGADIEDVAKAAFTLNDTLGISTGKEMEKALDALSVAGKEGNVELKDMAAQLPVLGAGFKSMQMGGLEAAATMGAALEVARKGAGDANEAANNLKNFMQKILSPTVLKKAHKTFGLDLYKIVSDAQKSGKNPFEAAMEAAMKATKGDQKKIGELFADAQVQNFFKAASQNWDEYKRIKDKALNASGVVDEDFNRIMGTSKMQMEALKNEGGRLAITFGSILLPSLTDTVKTITPIIGSVAKFAQENPKLIKTIIGVVGGLLALNVASKAASWGVLSLIGKGMDMYGMLLKVPGALGKIGSAMRLLGVVFTTTPVGVALLGIALAATLIIAYWTKVGPFFKKMWEGITFIFKTYYDIVVGMIEALLGWLQKAGDAVGAAFGRDGGGVDPEDFVRDRERNLPQPAMAGARSSQTVNDNSQTTINITQQPGESPEDLAKRIEKQRAQRAGVRARSSLTDGSGL